MVYDKETERQSDIVMGKGSRYGYINSLYCSHRNIHQTQNLFRLSTYKNFQTPSRFQILKNSTHTYPNTMPPTVTQAPYPQVHPGTTMPPTWDRLDQEGVLVFSFPPLETLLAEEGVRQDNAVAGGIIAAFAVYAWHLSNYYIFDDGTNTDVDEVGTDMWYHWYAMIEGPAITPAVRDYLRTVNVVRTIELLGAQYQNREVHGEDDEEAEDIDDAERWASQSDLASLNEEQLAGFRRLMARPPPQTAGDMTALAMARLGLYIIHNQQEGSHPLNSFRGQQDASRAEEVASVIQDLLRPIGNHLPTFDGRGTSSFGPPREINPEEFATTVAVADDEECDICREVYTEPMKMNVCTHVFCRLCIDSWVNDDQSRGLTRHCPFCRRSLI